MKIARSPDQLYSLGLGSCVGVAIYDPVTQIGGLIHVLLPSAQEFQKEGHIRTKFADSGISDLVEAIVKAGAVKFRLKAKMAGGAAMFLMKSDSAVGSIGRRNVQSCMDTLKKLNIELTSQDTGGTKGRTIIFDISSGDLIIKTIDQEEKVI